MTAPPDKREVILDPSHGISLFTMSPEPISLTLEPWGINLFPLPDYSYEVFAMVEPTYESDRPGSGLSAREVPLILDEPTTLWLGGADDYFMYRNYPHGPRTCLAKHASEPNRFLTNRSPSRPGIAGSRCSSVRERA